MENKFNITKIQDATPPTVSTINIDKSVFWALLLGIGIGISILSNDKSKRIELNIT